MMLSALAYQPIDLDFTKLKFRDTASKNLVTTQGVNMIGHILAWILGRRGYTC